MLTHRRIYEAADTRTLATRLTLRPVSAAPCRASVRAVGAAEKSGAAVCVRMGWMRLSKWEVWLSKCPPSVILANLKRCLSSFNPPTIDRAVRVAPTAGLNIQGRPVHRWLESSSRPRATQSGRGIPKQKHQNHAVIIVSGQQLLQLYRAPTEMHPS